jgi:DNA-directed RNA polymerase subunit RPC12/RpoP
MKLHDCAECGNQFDLHSPEKRRAGGKAIHCPDCSQETVVKYAGVQAGEGKTANVSILRFQSESDRIAYLDFWKANSGLHKGKSCQLSRGLKSTPAIKFETRVEFVANKNHKGRE